MCLLGSVLLQLKWGSLPHWSTGSVMDWSGFKFEVEVLGEGLDKAGGFMVGSLKLRVDRCTATLVWFGR